MKKAISLVFVLFLLSTPQIFASGKTRPIQNDQKAKEKVVLLKARDEAFNMLKSETKSKVEVRFDEKGVPTFLKGKLSLPASGDKKDFALEFLAGYRDLFLLKDPKGELNVKSIKEDKAGNTHIRFDQTYQGIPVWGAQILVHFNKDGSIKSVNGRWEPTPQIDITPILSNEDALKIAKDDLKNQNTFLKEPEAELLIFPWQNETYLALQVTLIPDLAHNWKYFIDAKTGNILLKYNDVKYDGPVTSSGVMLNDSIVSLNAYIMRDTIFLIDATKPMYVPPIDSQKGVIITGDGHNNTTISDDEIIFDPNSDTVFNDNFGLKAGVSAHYYIGKVYDYFYNNFGRNSWDDNGGRLVSIVHYDVDYNNAFWNGGFKAMFFGDGDGLEFSPFTGALDVVAHELGHGVTQATADLIYLGEWGALNEHLSDVWGAMLDREDWLIGEDVYTPLTPGDALRNMADPHNPGNPSDWQPAHMSEYVYYPWESGNYDNGGVHINSGVPNKACYLLALAITRDTTEQLYYQALNYYLFPTSRFVDLRWYLLQSAQDLYFSAPNYNHIRNSIEMAFDSVGVVDYYNYGWDILAYDDGNAYYYLYSDVNWSYAVRFTPHAPCSLLAVVAQFYTTGTNAYLHVWKDSIGYGIPGTELLNLNINRTLTYPDWQIIDLSGYNLHFDEDFYVGFTAASLDSFILSDSLMDFNYYNVYYDSGIGWFCVNPPGNWLTVLGNPLIQAIVKYDSLPPTDVGEEVVTLLPNSFSLYQNFPNPFNPETEIRYNLPKGVYIELTVHNILGQRLRTLVKEYQNVGRKSVHWDGKDDSGVRVASGVYFYLLKAGEYKESRKMLLLR